MNSSFNSNNNYIISDNSLKEAGGEVEFKEIFIAHQYNSQEDQVGPIFDKNEGLTFDEAVKATGGFGKIDIFNKK
jgi:hypothetical protein